VLNPSAVAPVEAQPGAGRPVVAPPEGAVEDRVWAGPWVVAAVVVDLWGAVRASAVAPRPWGAVALLPVAAPQRVRRWADACHNTRRICSQEERTSRTSDTVPGQLRLRPDRVEAALAASAAVAEAVLRRIAAVRTARRRAPSPGSCFRRMDSACSELYLVHSRHRSYSMLFSLGLGVTCQLL
jgi:hypothetical protein